MKKLILFAIVVLLTASAQETFAQRKTIGGEWAVGARFGGMSGLSLKKYGGYNTSAFEFIAGWNFDDKVKGFNITGLWEKLAPLAGNGQVSALFGLGPTLSFGDPFRLGATGILGFDWRLKAVPVNMQVDWAPTYFFVGGGHFSAINVAYTVRYILNNRHR
jgi:hypothetical protein